MKTRKVITAAVYLLTSLAWQSPLAATMYQYSGNTYTWFPFDDDPPSGSYTDQMRITGYFNVNTALPASQAYTYIGDLITAYSFNDGRTTLTDTDSSIVRASVETDVSGDISRWEIQFARAVDEDTMDQIVFSIYTTNILSGGDNVDIMLYAGDKDQAANPTNPGVWTSAVVVPIPTAVWLFGSALGLLGWMRRRKVSLVG
jgi:hypothetical protein